MCVYLSVYDYVYVCVCTHDLLNWLTGYGLGSPMVVSRQKVRNPIVVQPTRFSVSAKNALF